MANNRLELCEVDDNGNIVERIIIAKHSNEGWCIGQWAYDTNLLERLNEFFDECYISGNGIGITAEDCDEPKLVVYPYNSL